MQYFSCRAKVCAEDCYFYYEVDNQITGRCCRAPLSALLRPFGVSFFCGEGRDGRKRVVAGHVGGEDDGFAGQREPMPPALRQRYPRRGEGPFDEFGAVHPCRIGHRVVVVEHDLRIPQPQRVISYGGPLDVVEAAQSHHGTRRGAVGTEEILRRIASDPFVGRGRGFDVYHRGTRVAAYDYADVGVAHPLVA